MDIRKIQKTGGSTYVVSLPKKWVSSMGLGKNDSVFIQVQPDSSLRLSSQKDSGGEKEKLSKTLFVSDRSKHYLERELIGCYVMGYEMVGVKAESFIGEDVRKTIRDFTGKVMGMEIVDESVTKITLKDIMNPTELPFDTAIKRMFNIVKSMHKNMLFSLENLNKEMAQNVVSMDFEVNKLYWFVFRRLNSILRSETPVKLRPDDQVSRKSTLNYIFIARILERIGDHVENICKAVLDFPDTNIPATVLLELKRLSSENFATFEKCMGTLFTKDIVFLNTVFDSVEGVKPDIKKLRRTIQSEDIAHALQLGLILDSIRRIGEYTKDIAEHMINHIVDLESYTWAGTKKKGKEK